MEIQQQQRLGRATCLGVMGLLSQGLRKARELASKGPGAEASRQGSQEPRDPRALPVKGRRDAGPSRPGGHVHSARAWSFTRGEF